MQPHPLARQPLSVGAVPQHPFRGNGVTTQAATHAVLTEAQGVPDFGIFTQDDAFANSMSDIMQVSPPVPLSAQTQQPFSSPVQSPTMWNSAPNFAVGSPLGIPSRTSPAPSLRSANDLGNSNVEQPASPNAQQKRYTYAGINITPHHAPGHPPRTSSTSSSGGPKRLNWAEMICYTISESPSGRLVIQDLFEGMCIKFPEVREWALGKDWEARVKNRIKSTLSIKSNLFVKVPRPSSASGKGSWWTLSAEAQEAYRQGRVAEAVRSGPTSSAISPTLTGYSGTGSSSAAAAGRHYQTHRSHVPGVLHDSPHESPSTPPPFSLNIGTPKPEHGTPGMVSAVNGLDVHTESPMVPGNSAQMRYPQRMSSFDMFSRQPGSPQAPGQFPIDSPFMPMAHPMFNMQNFPLGFGGSPFGMGMHTSNSAPSGLHGSFYGGMNDGNPFYSFGAFSEQPQSAPMSTSSTQTQTSHAMRPQNQPQSQPKSSSNEAPDVQRSATDISQDVNGIDSLSGRPYFSTPFHNQLHQLNDNSQFDSMPYSPFALNGVGITGLNTNNRDRTVPQPYTFDMSHETANDLGNGMIGPHAHTHSTVAPFGSPAAMDSRQPVYYWRKPNQDGTRTEQS